MIEDQMIGLNEARQRQEPNNQIEFAEVEPNRCAESTRKLFGQCKNVFGCFSGSKIIQQGEIGLLLRFGKYVKKLPPGAYVINPYIEELITTSVKAQALPLTTVLTSDNVLVRISSFVSYEITRPELNYFRAQNVNQLILKRAQGVMLKTVNHLTLNDILIHRFLLSKKVVEGIKQDAHSLGINVFSFDIESIKMSPTMERSLAARALGQLRAESNLIMAKNEIEVSGLMKKSSELLNSARGEGELGLQLQYLETLKLFAENKKTTLLMPDCILGKGKGFLIPEQLRNQKRVEEMGEGGEVGFAIAD